MGGEEVQLLPMHELKKRKNRSRQEIHINKRLNQGYLYYLDDNKYANDTSQSCE
jgi:CRISPR/Cas system-associated exonuclease Cas4 (RecB family)